MEIAKLIEIDGEQIVLLPKKFQLKNMDEVVVQKAWECNTTCSQVIPV